MPAMPPQEFVAKWSKIQQKETAVSQSHFNDICALIGHQTPLEYDPAGKTFAFEAHTDKPGGQKGFADVAYEKMLKKRTLTNLYNGLQYYRQTAAAGGLFLQSEFDKVTRKSVGRTAIEELHDIHTALDTAVLDAYGWTPPSTSSGDALTDEEILERLLALNLERAEAARP